MLANLLGYPLPDFVGANWIPPVLGTVIFLYGGAPFLAGAWAELKKRQPGMMLLIAMAITVAFIASWATTLGLFNLDFWWGACPPDRDHAARALARNAGIGSCVRSARGACGAATGHCGQGHHRVVEVPVAELAVDDVVLVRSGARVPADGVVVSGSAAMDESMITGESAQQPATKGTGLSPALWRLTTRYGTGYRCR